MKIPVFFSLILFSGPWCRCTDLVFKKFVLGVRILVSISIFFLIFSVFKFSLHFPDLVDIFIPRSIVWISCNLPFNLVKVLKIICGFAAGKFGNLAETVLLFVCTVFFVGGVIQVGNFLLFLRLGTAPTFCGWLSLALLWLWWLVCGWSWVGGWLGGLGFGSGLLLANRGSTLKVGGLGGFGRLVDVSPSWLAARVGVGVRLGRVGF
jgi:hypothetical protein